MKFVTIALLGLCTMASQVMAQTALDLSGFELKNDNLKLMKLNFRDESEFIISKEKFKEAESAKKFCESQKSKLGSADDLLLLAMSGSMSANAFIEQSFTFKLSHKDQISSGIWSWDTDGDVLTFVDGGGGELVKAPIKEIGQMFKVRIPALCVKNLN